MYAHIAAVQEHKLGKCDYNYILELKGGNKWEWLGSLGNKRGKLNAGYM